MPNYAFILGANTLGLKYAASDAISIAESLQQYGYQAKLLQTELTSLRNNLQEIAATRHSDTVIFYFAGHGDVINNDLYLFLNNSHVKANQHLPISFVTQLLRQSEAKNKLLILDCCRAGKSFEEFNINLSEPYLVLSASGVTEKSREFDSLGAGFFTHHLCSALNKPQNTLLNEKGELFVNDLCYKYLRPIAEEHNRKFTSEQVPIPKLAANDDFPLINLAEKTLIHEETIKQTQDSKKVDSTLKKILIIAVSPNDLGRIDLGREVREISSALRKSSAPELIVEIRWAVTFSELQDVITKIEPQIIHFCGHGDTDGIILENEDGTGRGEIIEPERLARLFNSLSHEVECVVFNNCYSSEQGNAIASYIAWGVAMNGIISDEMAIKFSRNFYSTFKIKKNIKIAFDAARCSMGIASTDSSVPFLFYGGLYDKPSYYFNVIANQEEFDSGICRLLFLGINPRDCNRLRIDKELNEIYSNIEEVYGNLKVEQRWAVRFKDFQEALITFKPDIVHFAVSGSYAENCVVFEKDDGCATLVHIDIIKELLDMEDKKPNCIVFNFDQSDNHARIISQCIAYAVGVKGSITDDDAASFSGSLYRYFSLKQPVEKAVKRAKLDVKINSVNMPTIILFKQEITEGPIPEKAEVDA